MEIESLLSPPQAKRQFPSMSPSAAVPFTPLSSFNSDNQLAAMSKDQPSNHNRLPLSPPISPYTNAPKHDDPYPPQSHSQRDPELFPEMEEDQPVENNPLFPPEQIVIEATVDDHMMKQKQVPARCRPTKDEYMTMATMVSSVVKNMKMNPQKWYNREREYLNKRHSLPHPNKVIKQQPKQGRQNKQINDGYRKIAPKSFKAATGLKKDKHPELVPKTSRVGRTPRQTPKAQVSHSFDATSPYTPKTQRQPTARDDDDFHSLADWSPPLSTLANTARSLKMEWKGSARDLSLDPDRHLLHETEVQLASNLRLSCAQYLTAKRKIFIARAHCARIGKEFRKTDAQQACKIDVNKASRLWVAFDKVGWLDRYHIEAYL